MLSEHYELEQRRVQEQIKHFGHLSPLGYTGNGAAIKVEDWLRKFTKILDTVVITSDTDRVRLAIFQLSSTTDEWWEGPIRIRRPDSFTWDDFVSAFNVIFFPKATKQDLAKRFTIVY